MRIRPRALNGSWHCDSRMPKTPQLELWARSVGILNGALPRDHAQLCEWCGKGHHNPGSDARESQSLGGHYSVNTCQNGANEESININAKNRYQWTGCSIGLELGSQRYG